MRRLACILILSPVLLLGHDSWIALSDHYPNVGDDVTISIGNGHYYPESNYQINSRLIHASQLRRGEEITDLHFIESKSDLRCEVPLSHAGTYVMETILKQPKRPKPVAWIRSIAICDEVDDPAQYETGQGLEILPLLPLSSLRPGMTLPLVLKRDGTGIAVSLSVYLEDKATWHLQSDEQGQMEIRDIRAGTYLFAFMHGGQSCSLTLEIQP